MSAPPPRTPSAAGYTPRPLHAEGFRYAHRRSGNTGARRLPSGLRVMTECLLSDRCPAPQRRRAHGRGLSTSMCPPRLPPGLPSPHRFRDPLRKGHQKVCHQRILRPARDSIDSGRGFRGRIELVPCGPVRLSAQNTGGLTPLRVSRPSFIGYPQPTPVGQYASRLPPSGALLLASTSASRTDSTSGSHGAAGPASGARSQRTCPVPTSDGGRMR